MTEVERCRKLLIMYSVQVLFKHYDVMFTFCKTNFTSRGFILRGVTIVYALFYESGLKMGYRG